MAALAGPLSPSPTTGTIAVVPPTAPFTFGVDSPRTASAKARLTEQDGENPPPGGASMYFPGSSFFKPDSSVAKSFHTQRSQHSFRQVPEDEQGQESSRSTPEPEPGSAGMLLDPNATTSPGETEIGRLIKQLDTTDAKEESRRWSQPGSRPKHRLILVARIAPPVPGKGDEQMSIDDTRLSVETHRGGSCEFTFDRVWGVDDQQSDVFSDVHETVHALVAGTCGGFCYFGYGPSRSGKSYTMFGPIPAEDSTHLGVAFRTIALLFRLLEEARGSNAIEEFGVSFTMLEVYNDKMHDMLANLPDHARRPSASSSRGRSATGRRKSIRPSLPVLASTAQATTKMVANSSELAEMVEDGLRAGSATHFPGTHMVLTLSISIMKAGRESNSKLQFVELAASDSKLNTDGATMKSVAVALAAVQKVCLGFWKNMARIPFRDNKLTSLLSDSMGAHNPRALLLITLPAQQPEDCGSALHYAKVVTGADAAYQFSHQKHHAQVARKAQEAALYKKGLECDLAG